MALQIFILRGHFYVAEHIVNCRIFKLVLQVIKNGYGINYSV